MMRIKRAETEFLSENGIQPNIKELSKAAELPMRVAQRAYDLSKQDWDSTYQLDALLVKGKGPNASNATLLSTIADPAIAPITKLEQDDAWEQAKDELSREMKEKLTAEEIDLVEMRYGLHGKEKGTYREIARVTGLAERKVQSKVYSAVNKLKRYAKNKGRFTDARDLFD